MQDEIPVLEEERNRLRKSRDDIVEKFEEYKRKRVDLENAIREQRRKIKAKEKFCIEHKELRNQICDLMDKLDEKLQKMGRGDRSVKELSSFVSNDMKRHGLAPIENPDDDETDIEDRY